MQLKELITELENTYDVKIKRNRREFYRLSGIELFSRFVTEDQALKLRACFALAHRKDKVSPYSIYKILTEYQKDPRVLYPGFVPLKPLLLKSEYTLSELRDTLKDLTGKPYSESWISKMIRAKEGSFTRYGSWKQDTLYHLIGQIVITQNKRKAQCQRLKS